MPFSSTAGCAIVSVSVIEGSPSHGKDPWVRGEPHTHGCQALRSATGRLVRDRDLAVDDLLLVRLDPRLRLVVDLAAGGRVADAVDLEVEHLRQARQVVARDRG